MPEGQVSHRNAMVLSDAIAGSPITLVEAPEPRLGPQRLPERLTGDVLDHMEPRGKHHLFRFTSGRTLHSHLQMNGTWRAYAPGADIPRRGLWLALHTEYGAIAQYRGPVLRLYEPGARIPRVEAVGPDLLDDDVDPAGAATRLLALPPTREVGDAVMDQRVISGIGNVYKSETLFLAGIDPWRPVGSLSPAEAEAIGTIAAALLARGVAERGRITTYPLDDGTRRALSSPGVRPAAMGAAAQRGAPGRWVYGRARRGCRVCGTQVRARGQGDANRTTYWCPSCQG